MKPLSGPAALLHVGRGRGITDAQVAAELAGGILTTATQAAEFTTFNFRAGYQSGAVANTVTGAGTHAVAANIPGVRFYIISGGGTLSGTVTLTGRA